MNEHEIAWRAHLLPDQFASRLNESTNVSLRLMSEGGEWGELVNELLAALVSNGAVVTADEHKVIRELVEAMQMPAAEVDSLTVA